jgi:hypothetical protein
MIQDTPQGGAPIDIDAALANPSAHFGDPQAVLSHTGLSRKLKLKLLNQWEQDARLLAEAENEGMGGGEESMLARVRNALRTLVVEESNMNDTGKQTSVGAPARNITTDPTDRANRVRLAAARTRAGVSDVRAVIREQPITVAVLMFTFGYLFGRLGSLVPSGGRR